MLGSRILLVRPVPALRPHVAAAGSMSYRWPSDFNRTIAIGAREGQLAARQWQYRVSGDDRTIIAGLRGARRLEFPLASARGVRVNESAARDVMVVRALEVSDVAREIWSDADRVAASRAAAEDVGEAAADHDFLGRRAALVVERIARRHPAFVASTRARSLRQWIVPVTAVGAFVVGLAGVEIGPNHRINLLAPPVLALLAWNVAVYVALLVELLARIRVGAPAWVGPLRRSVIGWVRDVARPLRPFGTPVALTAAAGRFTAEWSSLATPLWRARAGALLHLGAATMAVGAIAGLYLRGIALEYRAGWQSTFLDAADVERILRIVLAPGAWLSGIAIPDAGHLRTIDGGSAGENAAQWIHLYAGTILLVVIVPRVALAVGAWIAERRRQRTFPIALGDPYFQGLLRGWRQGTARIAAVAYSYDVPRVNADGIVKLMTRALQSSVDVQWLPVTAYGADELPALPAPAAAIIIVFNLAATPERETHGAFARALAAARADAGSVVALVDTSDFFERFGGEPRRIAERQETWQRMLAAAGIDAVFARLAKPDLAHDGAALAARLACT